MPRQFTLPVLAMCIAVAMAGILGGGRALAASSAPAASDMVSARLLTAENGVAPGASTVSAALEISLTQGWKTYWRTPGEVGLPPRIEWSGSRNVAGAEILWPAPDRFTAFGIENFGYSGETVLPLRVNLENPGEPVALRAQVSLLICAEICVPQDFDLALDLPAGTGIDPEAAASIARHVARVPLSTEEAGLSLERAHLDDEALTLALRAQAAFTAPDIFPELGEGAALGAPDIRLGEDGRFLWARLPVLAPVTPGAASITVTDGARAVTLDLPLSETPPAPPFDVQERHAGAGELVAVALVALLGGLILNVMPCVLPVLSIKLSSALTAQGQSPVRVRGGFLMAALGVMLFMWGLAAATLAARAFGLSVGWGLQFQNPVFLAAMFMILVVFAANLLGLYEINLPASWQTRLARADGAPGYGGDLATGAFAAVLATPCSAPFLGTALAFALSGRVVDVLVIFTALGLGLALPYLLVAAVPGAMLRLPRPGRWMLWVKLGLGVLLAVTAGWLIWVLSGVGGGAVAVAVLAASAVLVGVLALRRIPGGIRALACGILVVVAMVAPAVLRPEQGVAQAAARWQAFDRAAIARHIAAGQVVFVDITADWCLTCKANKALVIGRAPVSRALEAAHIVPMRGDWTRPDPAIGRYLESLGRYGIPFNAVYGPSAPEGILLPELLSAEAVVEALERAR